MFTLQILDQGQTLLYSPPTEPVTLGSAEVADFQLSEDGVEAEHLRLEPVGQGLRLVAQKPVLVNGQSTVDIVLQLGDRIEIGKAVIVVGRSVARPAKPEDVLASPRTGGGRRPQPRRSRLPYVLVAVAVVITGVLAVFNSGDEQQVDGNLELIAAARNSGDLKRARDHIALCRVDWRGATDDRLERLAAEEDKVDAIERYAIDLEAAVLDPTSGPYAKWITELQRLEHEGQPHERVAARLQRSKLTETMQRRKRMPAAPVEAGGPEAGDPGTVVADNPPPQQTTATPTSIIADADRLAEQGLFAQAIAVIESELGQADASGLMLLQRQLTSLRAEALVAMQTIVADAESKAVAGRHGEAVTALVLAQHRFPGGGEFAKLPETLSAIEGSAAAAAANAATREKVAQVPAAPANDPTKVAKPQVDDSAPKIPLSALRARLDRIRDNEAAGAFSAAATMLREAATMARERDADFAARLDRRAAQADQRAAFHGAVVSVLEAGRQLVVALHSGRDVVIESVRGSRFVAGSERVAWKDISGAGLSALVDQVGASGEAAIGAATLIYDAGDSARAEEILAGMLRADATFKTAVDRAVAEGRGERYDERGYQLGKDGFISMRAVELQKEIRKIASRIDGVFRKKDKGSRQRFVADLLTEGPDTLDALGFAFEQDLEKQVYKLDASALKKQVGRLATQREALDKARVHAKDLIYDEVKYFYPYRPPAVSSDRLAEYNRVQAEVNRRIDAVRRLWRDNRLEVKVPRSLQSTLERIDWVTRVLQDVGAFDAKTLARIEWIRALPIGRSIGIADYCKTVAERNQIDEWRHIAAYNKTVGRDLSSSVRELLRITNDYRTMFRHRPLAVSPLVCNAAKGHAEEMSRLGYFAHMSPTPGRRTPFDRMKIAGYRYGVSENIALNSSALGAHNSWLGSSGHHRNLLNPRHKEMGIGADGRNWVENFGGGATYSEHPAYLEAKER